MTISNSLQSSPYKVSDQQAQRGAEKQLEMQKSDQTTRQNVQEQQQTVQKNVAQALGVGGNLNIMA